jgi:hypothetical protein
MHRPLVPNRKWQPKPERRALAYWARVIGFDAPAAVRLIETDPRFQGLGKSFLVSEARALAEATRKT